MPPPPRNAVSGGAARPRCLPAGGMAGSGNLQQRGRVAQPLDLDLLPVRQHAAAVLDGYGIFTKAHTR